MQSHRRLRTGSVQLPKAVVRVNSPKSQPPQQPNILLRVMAKSQKPRPNLKTFLDLLQRLRSLSKQRLQLMSLLHRKTRLQELKKLQSLKKLQRLQSKFDYTAWSAKLLAVTCNY